MDILAAMLAYLVSVSVIVGGLAISCVAFFATPDRPPAMPAQAVAMVTEQHVVTTVARAKPPAMREPIDKRPVDKHPVPGAAKAASEPRIDVAIDARQKPLLSNAQLRRLADRERAKRLAYRERSSFETRFLHYDD